MPGTSVKYEVGCWFKIDVIDHLNRYLYVSIAYIYTIVF